MMMFICSPEGDTVCKNSSEFLAEQALEIKRGEDDIVDGENLTRLISHMLR